MPVTKVLCVAEKPSIAKAVANHLSGNHTSTSHTGCQYVKNYSFHYTFQSWGPCDVVMTSVLGHLFSHDFDPRYRSWRSCDPADLFEANIHTYVERDKKPMEKNIAVQARQSSILFIWTDCDREGESIGAEIRKVAVDSNNRLSAPGKVARARFSNIERNHVVAAAQNPLALDELQAGAVTARMELDLRIGASFTRNLTMSVQHILASAPGAEERQIVSYGSCQFPTLGFVVDRYLRVRNFVPEPFWSIRVMHEKDGVKVDFRWARGRLFDRMAVVILFERCLASRTAKVASVATNPTRKWKPLPLTTVELQKCGSRFLRMDSARVMQIAEALYTKGWISYPRTETDQFDRGMDLRALVQKQTQGGPWAPFAQGLMGGGFSQPRSGRNNDKAHPPIHPVNFVDPSALTAEEQRVHEFVVRRFLACCAEDAQGSKTEVRIIYGVETFTASGLMVLARNYLDVYPYDTWTSSQPLPQFTQGEEFEPTEARAEEGKTSPPGYLTEPELIALMDANGIGTDATMAEHISRIKERKYVETRPRGRQARTADDGSDDDPDDAPPVRGRGRGRAGRGRGRNNRGDASARGRGGRTSGVQEFIPTTLGAALVEGYADMGFEISLTKPYLRKEMELKMKAVCEGRKSRREVIDETIEQYRAVYAHTQQRLDMLQAAVRKYVLGEGG